MRILLVDDDVQFLQAFARLHGGEHEITTASSASRAFVALADGKFDVILCDVQMPEVDGVAFAKKLFPLDAARLIFISGDPDVLGKHSLPHPSLWKCSSKEELKDALDSVVGAEYRNAG